MLRLEEQRLFNDALASANVDALSGDEAQGIATFLGMGPFVELCRSALRGEEQPRQRLSHFSRVARACTAAQKRLRMPYATFDRLEAARAQDARGFGKTFMEAVDGDQRAKDVIKGWLSPIGDPSPPPRPPVHATPVPPPPPAQTAPQATPSRAPEAPSTRSTVATNASNPPAQRETAPPPRHVPIAGASALNVHPLRPSRHEMAHDAASVGSPAPVRQYDQVEVYGRDRRSGTALQIENSPTKKDRNVTTINLSIGRAKQARTQDGVDWQNKIIVMLTGDELLMVFAVLNKLLPSVRFAGHGAANDKWIEVTEVTDAEWAGQVRVTIAQGKGPQADIRSVGIGYKDMPYVIDIFTRAGLSQFPSAGNLLGLLAMARRDADLYEKAMAASQMRKPRATG